MLRTMPRTNPVVLVAGLSLFGLAVAVPGRARAQVDDPDALLREDRAAALKRIAAQLFAQARYRDALAQYQAAYAVRQEAALLLLIARTHQHLGDLREARAFYARYLTAAPAGPSDLRSEAEQAIARLDQLSPPPPLDLTQPFDALAAYPVALKRFPYNEGMRIAGISFFVSGYLSSMLLGFICLPTVGASNIGFAPCGTMFIPGVGPVISGGLIQSELISVPVALLGAVPQVLGIGLWGGAYRHPETRVVPHEPQAQLAPLGSTGTGGLAVGVRF